MIDIEAGRELTARQQADAERITVLAEGLGLDPEDLDMAVRGAASKYASAEASSSGAVDDVVAWDALHEEAGRQAAEINNGGLSAQIGYLVYQYGAEMAERIVQVAVEEVSW